mgnify:CR=1 FL=1
MTINLLLIDHWIEKKIDRKSNYSLYHHWWIDHMRTRSMKKKFNLIEYDHMVIDDDDDDDDTA